MMDKSLDKLALFIKLLIEIPLIIIFSPIILYIWAYDRSKDVINKYETEQNEIKEKKRQNEILCSLKTLGNMKE